ncbi:MAG: OmpA family protein, partial [Roseomonas sp.]|nr:OmpA family protein [Roseomonas sp.]
MKLKFLGIAGLALLAACSSSENSSSTGAGMGAGNIRPGSQEDLVANVGDRVFFDFDRSNIRADQRPVLQRQAEWMGRYPEVRVQVEGHTDERGTREYNLALGQRRANAARDVLVEGGVNPSRVSTISLDR